MNIGDPILLNYIPIVGFIDPSVAQTSGLSVGGTLVVNTTPPPNIVQQNEIIATRGIIGGWNIRDHEIYSNDVRINSQGFLELGAGNNNIRLDSLDATYRIWVGNVVPASAAFNVTKAGVLTATGAVISGTVTATSGTIGGWTIGATFIADNADASLANVLIDSANKLIRLGPTSGNYITVDGTNKRIRSSNYVANASGFNIDSDLVEAQNIRARGVLQSAVFQKSTISAVGGILLIAGSDALDADMTALDSSNLTIKGNATFAANDIVRIKDGVDEEYLRITSAASAPTYSVTRDLASAYAANTNPIWKRGQAVVKQGSSDGAAAYSGGWLQLFGDGTNSPYYSVFQRTGIAYNATTEVVRLGNLNGIGGFATNVFGIYMGDGARNKFSFDGTNVDFKGGKLFGRTSRAVAPGESIANAIADVSAAGGGTVFLSNGTHTPGANIVLSSSVSLIGENTNATIIDFASGSYQILVQGSAAYSTGTVSIPNNSTTVTGSGTTWTGNVTAGQNILLSGIWYPITVVNSNTSLTIALPYGSATLSGSTYTIATTIQDVIIKNITVKNSAIAAIKVRYASSFYLIEPVITGSVVGVDIDDSSQLSLSAVKVVACYDGFQITNSHFGFLSQSSSLDALTGVGMSFISSTSWALNASFVINSAANGVEFTSCDDFSVSGSTSIGNRSNGFELISGNTNLVFQGAGAQDNGGSAVLDSNVLGLWHCDGAIASAAKIDNAEGTAAYDIVEEGSGHTAGAGYDGATNGSYDLAGAASLYMGDIAGLASATKATFQSRVYFDSVAGTDYMLNQWNNAGTQNCFLISRDLGELSIYIAASLTDSGSNFGVTSGLGLTTGTWYYITVVYDGTATGNANRLKLYVNPASVTDTKTLGFTGTIPASLTNSSSDVYFGKVSGNSNYMDGRVDEIRISNVARTGFEVFGAHGILVSATSDENVFQGCVMKGNTQYGIRIGAATCDKNVIIGNILTGNTVGTVSDSGTGTIYNAANNAV